MKKFLALVLTLAMVLSLAACGGTSTSGDTASGDSSDGDTASAGGTEISLWTYPVGNWGD